MKKSKGKKKVNNYKKERKKETEENIRKNKTYFSQKMFEDFFMQNKKKVQMLNVKETLYNKFKRR